jgi:hypothetical protein
MRLRACALFLCSRNACALFTSTTIRNLQDGRGWIAQIRSVPSPFPSTLVKENADVDVAERQYSVRSVPCCVAAHNLRICCSAALSQTCEHALAIALSETIAVSSMLPTLRFPFIGRSLCCFVRIRAFRSCRFPRCLLQALDLLPADVLQRVVFAPWTVAEKRRQFLESPVTAGHTCTEN